MYLRIWFFDKCHSSADMLQYIFMTSSYLLPPKPRISRSLLQTQGTSRVFWHFSHRYLRFWFIGTMPFLCKHVTVHFYDFLILVFPKTKVFKVTNSNTIKEPQRFSGIYLTYIWGSGLFGTVILLRTGNRTFFIIPSYLFPLKPRFTRSQLQTQGTSRVF